MRINNAHALSLDSGGSLATVVSNTHSDTDVIRVQLRPGDSVVVFVTEDGLVISAPVPQPHGVPL